MSDIPISERLIIAADFAPDSSGRKGVHKKIMALADQLEGTGVIFKMNSALRALGMGLIREINERGLKVFADYKLVDIPATMEIDGLFLTEDQPAIVTAMANAGTRGLRALSNVLPLTEVLAVTVLTSLDEEECLEIFGCTPAEGVARFAKIAQDGNVDGLILSPKELGIIADMPDIYLDCNTPGIRPSWTVVEGDDQSRVTTPADAIAAGAKRLVIGRPITQADNPRMAVERTLDEIASVLD